eukprot:3218633-Rhodomonas_salina.1
MQSGPKPGNELYIHELEYADIDSFCLAPRWGSTPPLLSTPTVLLHLFLDDTSVLSPLTFSSALHLRCPSHPSNPLQHLSGPSPPPPRRSTLAVSPPLPRRCTRGLLPPPPRRHIRAVSFHLLVGTAPQRSLSPLLPDAAPSRSFSTSPLMQHPS